MVSGVAGEPGATFFALTPDRVLDAVEVGGLRCTGRCLPLRAFENRVYEVELEDERRLVVKFYRPGRWSREAILDEHAFLAGQPGRGGTYRRGGGQAPPDGARAADPRRSALGQHPLDTRSAPRRLRRLSGRPARAGHLAARAGPFRGGAKASGGSAGGLRAV